MRVLVYSFFELPKTLTNPVKRRHERASCCFCHSLFGKVARNSYLVYYREVWWSRGGIRGMREGTGREEETHSPSLPAPSLFLVLNIFVPFSQYECLAWHRLVYHLPCSLSYFYLGIGLITLTYKYWATLCMTVSLCRSDFINRHLLQDTGRKL